VLSAATAELLVVTVAASVVIVHAVLAARVAVATVKATFALLWPVFATTVLKVLVPQAAVVGAVMPLTV